MTLSICMIVRDEHETLERALESVRDIADEIIIVDTGSLDDTKDIALKFTNKVYDFKWCDDFSKARNYSFEKAKMDYIMWLDADDVLEKQEAEKLKKLKATMAKSVDIVMLKYNLGVDKNNIPAVSYYRERIIKNNKGYKWVGPIHEVIPMTGNVIKKDIAITHKKEKVNNPKRNIEIFNKMKENSITFDARQTFYYARELMYVGEYEKSIDEYKKFLAMDNAWVENIISAHLDLHNIYLLKGDDKKAIENLLFTFKYDMPRAEVCTKIGQYFIKEKEYMNAKYWLLLAVDNTNGKDTGAFFIEDYTNFLPYTALSVCYYYLGNIKEAILYNEKAGKIKPDDEVYISNKQFYSQVSQS